MRSGAGPLVGACFSDAAGIVAEIFVTGALPGLFEGAEEELMLFSDLMPFLACCSALYCRLFVSKSVSLR